MRLRLFIFGLLWGWATTVSPAWAEVQVSARVDRSTISPGESLQLEVSVSGGSGGGVDISPITDFKVLSRNTSSSVQIINGRFTKEVTYNFVLMHLKQGNLIIPPLTVTVDGRPYQTEPITVSVSDRTPGSSAGSSQDKEVWVTADLSDSTPFVGQQIAYTFRMHDAVKVNDAKVQPPEFTGFSAKKIEDRKSYRKVINGREHIVTEVYYVLTPLAKGPLTIDPAVLHVGIVRQNRRRSRSPFDNFFNRGVVEPRVLQTEPLEISVRPLPPVPPPQAFSGLVGRFDLTAEMESSDLKVGDSATLTITIEGEGNIMDAQPPELELPTSFKSYADNPEEEINLDRMGTKGKKVFRIALVPVEPGTYSLPPIDVVYFDVEEEAYRTLHTEVPVIHVAAADPSGTQPLTATPGPLPLQKKKVAFTGRDILPPKESLAAIQPQAHLGWPVFILCLTGPALVFGCAALVDRMRRPQTSAGALMKAKARQALKMAAGQSGEEFLTSLYQALTAAIFSVANRTGEALTWKEAESLLLDNNVSKEEADRAAKLLSDIESCKFSGAKLEEDRSRQLLNQTRTMVRKLAP
jgi:hypothetical protein